MVFIIPALLTLILLVDLSPACILLLLISTPLQRVTYSSSHIIGLGLVPNTKLTLLILTHPTIYYQRLTYSSSHIIGLGLRGTNPHPIPNPVNTNRPCYLLPAPDVLVESHHRARAAWHQPPRHQVLAVLPRGRLSFLPMHRLLPLCQGTLVNHTPVHYVL